MFIPLRTDAPLYHYPIATTGLIVTNVVVHLCVCSLSFSSHPGILTFGNGLHPLEWLTSIFRHAGLAHLIGNMIFLWCFGMVVEGKIGWLRFLGIYLGIGVIESMVTQIGMLGSRGGGALGASAAIMGVVAIACLWAPRNTVTCGVFFYFRCWYFDASILAVAGFFIAFDIFAVVLSNYAMSGSLAHLIGAVFGAAVGFVFIHKRWVDCEGYDVVSIFNGREGRRTPSTEALREQAETKLISKRLKQERLAEARQQVSVFLDSGNVDAAIRLLEKIRQQSAAIQLTMSELEQIINLCNIESRFSQAQDYLEEFIGRFPHQSINARLQLARCQLREQRPRKCLKTLSPLTQQPLNSNQRAYARQLAQAAKGMSCSVLEISED